MRPMLVVPFCALLSCSDSERGRIEQDGTTGLDLIGEECPSCELVGNLPETGVMYLHLPGYARGMQFDVTMEVVTTGGQGGQKLSIWAQPMNPDTGDVVGERMFRSVPINAGVVDVTWSLDVPDAAMPFAPAIGVPLTFRTRGCLGRLDAMCGTGDGTFGTGDHETGWTWGLAQTPCPASCD